MTVIFIEQRGGPVLVMSIDVLGHGTDAHLDPHRWGRATMSIPRLQAPRAYAGDGPGPFTSGGGGRDLRILVDVPAEQRQMDDSVTTFDQLGVPDAARFLWTLGQRDDITMYWIASSDDADADGAVRLHDPDRDRDQLPFTAVSAVGGGLRAVWPYRQWEDLAARSIPAGAAASGWLRDVLVARVAVELRMDVLVTSSKALLESGQRWVAEANPLTAEQALAVVGLYLRGRHEYPMAAPNILTFGEHLLRWSAVRAQLPSGWRWGSALVAHSHAVGRDGPTLLSGSLHERIVRALRCRDRIHTALLVPQNNQTADEATEALDYLMVNLVGAFDAAARAAHLVLGFSPDRRRWAAWQSERWRSMVQAVDPKLADLFAPGTAQSAVLETCRILRNTVHGEALQNIAVSAAGAPRQTLVRLPEDDAHDLGELFDQLGGRDEWGLRPLAGMRMHVDPQALVEHLLLQALQTLDDALRLTPVERLKGVIPGQLITAPPEDLSFGLGTRTRACMLSGLPIPAT